LATFAGPAQIREVHHSQPAIDPVLGTMNMMRYGLVAMLIAIPVTAPAQPCGETCLSQSDQAALTEGRAVIKDWMSDFLDNPSDSPCLWFSRGGSVTRGAVVELNDVRNKTADFGLRHFYARIISGMSGIKDTFADIASSCQALMSRAKSQSVTAEAGKAEVDRLMEESKPPVEAFGNIKRSSSTELFESEGIDFFADKKVAPSTATPDQHYDFNFNKPVQR
jgi:hypothetical protein